MWGYQSYTTGDKVYQANVQRTATFVNFVAEGYIIQERNGKQVRDVEHHRNYAVYLVGNTRVMFESRSGMAWPNQVYVYGN